MKKTLTICILLTICWMGNLSAQVRHFTWQGVEREYIVRTPAEHDGPLPVLFFLHGLSVLISPCDQEFNFSQMAEDYGWAIVVPQARNLGMGTMWNVGMTNSDVDDVGFLLALLDTLTAELQLDPDSVFFTGFSMGGFMTHHMAIEHGDRITACAPVSGLVYNAQASMTPVAPVRMLHIHGTNDNVVGYDGNSSVFGSNLGLGVDAILNYWQNANGCGGEPAIDTLPDLKNDGLRFIRYTYNCGTDLQHLKVAGGTHRWYHSANQYDVGFMDIIHDFFTGRGTTPGVAERETGHLRAWPSPTSGVLNIQFADQNPPVPEIKVYDVYGKLMNTVETCHGASLQTVQINLSRYPDGVYFVQAGNGAVAKVVVAK